MPSPLSRRRFLTSSAGAGTLLFLPRGLRGQHGTSANDRLRLALIGVGGRGHAALTGLDDEQFVAFCDVDEKHGRADVWSDPDTASVLERFKDARWFKDYRLMFETMADQIDAVVVATPDHNHFPAAMAAVAHGKHVYVEKPLCRCISEVRRLQAAAQKAGVVTQMGNQGRAGEGIRAAREWIQAGVIGAVHTVHAWTNRPNAGWFPKDGFAPEVPVAAPAALDWDLWLGPAPKRPFRPEYLPKKWRVFTAFGTGALGDMGCHQLDAAVYALDLEAPISVEAGSSAHEASLFPNRSTVTWKFPARGPHPPLDLRWFDGDLRPPLPVPGFTLAPEGGSLFYGTKGILWVNSHSRSARLLPESRMEELRSSLPPKTIPRVMGGQFKEWADAIRSRGVCGSGFGYSGRLSEIVLLGAAALRADGFLHWDHAAMRFPDRPDCDRFAGPGYDYRAGWMV